MANFVQLRNDFGDAFSNTFSHGYANALREAAAEKERKRQEEANAMLGQMYLDSMRQPADAAVAPRIADATKAGNAFQTAEGNLAALNAPITTSPDGLADTRAVRAMLKDPQGMDKLNAMQTPEMPVDTTQLQAYNQALAPAMQAQVNQLQSQDNQAQQMLAAAKEKYGTAMFDRLAPIVASGKVPAQIMIQIIEKQIQTAEKTALKQAQSDAYKKAMELMKQGRVDDAKMLIAEYLSPDAQGRMLASLGQGAGIHSTVKLSNGNWGIVDKMGKITDTGTSFAVSPRGGGGGAVNPNTHDPNTGLRLGKEEKWAQTYELSTRLHDENLLAEYQTKLALYQDDPENEDKNSDAYKARKWLEQNNLRVKDASSRMNNYWRISSGGAYGTTVTPPPANTPPPAETTAPANETPAQRQERLKKVLRGG